MFAQALLFHKPLKWLCNPAILVKSETAATPAVSGKNEIAT